MLQIYDSLSRQKRPFKPVREGQVRLYVCGMTVYDFCHLGHARMLVSFDVIQRWLRISGYDVQYVRNITDIDDKIIRRAVQTGQRLSEVTAFFIDAMHADERVLNVQSPDDQPRATAFVPQMLDIIEQLQTRGFAYQADDGDVNFSVRSFPGYGKLSGKTLDQLRSGERVAVSSAKRDPLDFVLWKSAKADEPEESKWSSPFGQGRPGWHIECSAMSRSVLGLPLDIHGGGPDLKFPHHENEIAQTEGAFGGTLANTWMHCGPLMVDAEKMSKSLGNFMTIRQTVCADATDDQVPYQANPREAEMLRFFIIRNHYRSIQNYAPDNLADAQSALDRLYQTLQAVPPALNFDESSIDWTKGAPADFKQAMDDDFNTAGAISVLFELASSANRDQDTKASALMRVLGEMMGLLQQVPSEYFKVATRYTKRAFEAAAAAQSLLDEQQTVVEAVVVLDNEAVDQLIAERKAAKLARDFATADRIRDQLTDSGVLLDDKPGGVTEWRRG